VTAGTGPSGPVGVAIIGAGNISSEYLKNLMAFPDVDVRFVADLLPERARARAAEHGVPASGTLEQALASDDVELVVDLTIPAAHAEVARAALDAGKHVWNEKPIAVELAAAAALVEQAESAGLRVGVAPDTFLGPGLQAARRMIDAGVIGRPLTASVVMQSGGPEAWHPSPEFLYDVGAGPLFDIGPYYLTCLAQTFGSFVRVSAMGASTGPTRTIATGPKAGQTFDVRVPTYVAAIYGFERAGVAQATFSFDAPLRRVGVVEIAGTEATLVLPDPNTFERRLHIVHRGSDTRTEVPVGGTDGGRGIGVVEMARAIRAGTSHRASGRLGFHVLDTMVATAASIASGLTETIDSRIDPIPALPEDWDPGAATL
jgi:predicted dehydrogenase